LYNGKPVDPKPEFMEWIDVNYETKDKKYYEVDLSIGVNGEKESQYLIETIQATNSTNLI
jgi:hypothetical protein